VKYHSMVAPGQRPKSTPRCIPGHTTPNFYDLLTTVSKSVTAYKVCHTCIDAVEKDLGAQRHGWDALNTVTHFTLVLHFGQHLKAPYCIEMAH